MAFPFRSALPLFTSGLLSTAPSGAHDWYPAQRCSEKDCRPLIEAKGETALQTAEGWRLWDGPIIPRRTVKPSPDQQFHLCETPTKTVLFFFAPPGNS
jgi:hypothetical protein